MALWCLASSFVLASPAADPLSKIGSGAVKDVTAYKGAVVGLIVAGVALTLLIMIAVFILSLIRPTKD